MAIQRSGPIKFSEIATEFPLADSDGNASTTNKFSDFYRGRITSYVHSGTANIPTDTTDSNDADNPALSISNFYNTSRSEYINYYYDEANPIENGLTIDFSNKTSAVNAIIVIGNRNNTECLDFLDELYDNNVNGWRSSNLPRGRAGSIPSINGIGYISSQNPDIPALTIKNVPADSFIWVRNFGFIVGAGGDGGVKKTGDTDQSSNSGSAGGDGIYVTNVNSTSDVLIENWGAIAGGAGGGGAGGQGGLAESTFQTYNPVTNYYDSSSATANYTIANAHIGFVLERRAKKIAQIALSFNPRGAYITYRDVIYRYGFYFVKVRNNTYHLKFKLGYTVTTDNTVFTTSSYGSVGDYVINTLTKISASDGFTNDTNFSNYFQRPDLSNITVDDVTFAGTNPSRTDFAAVSQAIPFSNNYYSNVKNITDNNGNSFHTVLSATFPSLSDTYGITGTNNSYYFKKAFKTLTASSNLTTNISHGGAGGQGAHFAGWSSSTTSIAGSSGEVVQDTVGITTYPNAIYHPEFKFGQGGQGVSGNGWTVTAGADPNLTLQTTTSTSTNIGENGTGTNGKNPGSQGGSGVAINTSLSNVIVTDY